MRQKDGAPQRWVIGAGQPSDRPVVVSCIADTHLGMTCGSKEAGLRQSGGRGARSPTCRVSRSAFHSTSDSLAAYPAEPAAHKGAARRSRGSTLAQQSRRGDTLPGPTGGTPTDVRYTAGVDTGMLCRARKQSGGGRAAASFRWDCCGDAGRDTSGSCSRLPRGRLAGHRLLRRREGETVYDDPRTINSALSL